MGNTECKIVNATQSELRVTLKDRNLRESTLLFAPNQIQKKELPQGQVTVSVFQNGGEQAAARLTEEAEKVFIIKAFSNQQIHVVTSSILPKLCIEHEHDINHFFACKDWTKPFSLASAAYKILCDFDVSHDEKRFFKEKYQKELLTHLEARLLPQIVANFVVQLQIEIGDIWNERLGTAGATIVPATLTAALTALVVGNIMVVTSSVGSTFAITTAGVMAAVDAAGAAGASAGSITFLTSGLAATGIGLAIGAVLGSGIFLGINLSWSREQLLIDLSKKVVEKFPDTVKANLIQAYLDSRNLHTR